MPKQWTDKTNSEITRLPIVDCKYEFLKKPQNILVF